MSNINTLNEILISEEEKREVKKNSPESLPLNPTAQGYSGQEIRRMLGASIVGDKGSMLALLEGKMALVKEHFEKGLYGLVLVDDTTTYVDVTLDSGVDATFTKDLTALILKLDNVEHGFFAGVNFTTKNNAFPIVINNESDYPLKIIRYNLVIPSVQVSPNKTINMSFYCDGINVYCQYIEV